MIFLSGISFTLCFIHIPQDACAEVIWLTCVWHKWHRASNPYHISWHFLDWQPWTDRFLDKLFIPSRSLLLLQVVFYNEYLSSVSKPQGGCSSAGIFFSLSKYTFLLLWSAPLLGLQAREGQMSMLQFCCQHPTVMVQGLLLARHLFKGLTEFRHSVQAWQKWLILIFIAWNAL